MYPIAVGRAPLAGCDYEGGPNAPFWFGGFACGNPTLSRERHLRRQRPQQTVVRYRASASYMNRSRVPPLICLGELATEYREFPYAAIPI